MELPIDYGRWGTMVLCYNDYKEKSTRSKECLE